MKESPLAPGTMISHYRILSRLGAGGMGEVYLAEDGRLGRKVALKLLSPELTRDEDRVRRFEQEARAISTLNHPNIITVYEIGHMDSGHFIATEFIEGETLRQYLSRVRRNLQEVLDIAIQIAGALSAAHAAGVMHRDIKPENIMLRPDGYVKVLDFGLAKLVEIPASSGDHDSPTVPLFETEPGILMGTVSYMSPEQGRGVKVDPRTDIFSFGIVLYEMIGGRVPFEGSTPSEVIAAILEREPSPLPRYAPGVPAELERIVNKALRKNREERYQTVKDLLIDLKSLRQELEFSARLQRSLDVASDSGETRPSAETVRLPSTATEIVSRPRSTSSAEYLLTEFKRHKKGTAAVLASVALVVVGMIYFGKGAPSIGSLAVMPFVSQSTGPDADVMTDGITERLISSLSQLPNLKVRSLSSVLRYKGQQTDPRTVGRDLSVEAVLTGRVVQRGDGLSISIELVDARDNSLIWGEQYTRKLADMMLLQEEIAGGVSSRLGLQLTREEKRRLEAYQLYHKGRYYWNRRTAEGLRTGIEFFGQAIEKDPEYVLPYAGLADSYNMLVVYGALSPREGFPKAKASAIKALEMDDKLAEAHTSLGFVAERFDWDWATAEAEYKRAIDLKPEYATAHHRYGVFLCAMGRFNEAASELRQAQQLDPLSMIINADLSRPLYFAGQYERAIDQFRKAVAMDQNFTPGHRYLGLAYAQTRLHAESIASLQNAVTLSGDSGLMKTELAYAYAVAGRKAEALKILDELIETSRSTYVPSYFAAVIRAGLGQKDQALEALQKAVDERYSGLTFLRVEPMLAGLRSDPRFTEILKRVGL